MWGGPLGLGEALEKHSLSVDLAGVVARELAEFRRMLLLHARDAPIDDLPIQAAEIAAPDGEEAASSVA